MEYMRKIGQWLWVNKERVVLAILVVILAYRVYLIANPREEEALLAPTPTPGAPTATAGGTAPGATGMRPGLGAPGGAPGGGMAGAQMAAISTGPAKLVPPKRIAFDQLDEIEWDKKPPTPPNVPIPPAAVAFDALVKGNPFAVLATQIEGPVIEEEERPNLRLLDIKQWPDGSWRAQIQTRARRWFAEGDKFEAYELQRIDPDAQTVEIFSTQHGKSYVYTRG